MNALRQGLVSRALMCRFGRSAVNVTEYEYDSLLKSGAVEDHAAEGYGILRKKDAYSAKCGLYVRCEGAAAQVAILMEFWGERACFTCPEMKTERVSYDVPTPSAVRGMIENVYFHSGMKWIVDRIWMLSPIRFVNVRRNEVKSKNPRIQPHAGGERRKERRHLHRRGHSAARRDDAPGRALCVRGAFRNDGEGESLGQSRQISGYTDCAWEQSSFS